jgi:hypothetical protein
MLNLNKMTFLCCKSDISLCSFLTLFISWAMVSMSVLLSSGIFNSTDAKTEEKSILGIVLILFICAAVVVCLIGAVRNRLSELKNP